MKLKHLFSFTMFLFMGMLCLSSVNAIEIPQLFVNHNLQSYYNTGNISVNINTTQLYLTGNSYTGSRTSSTSNEILSDGEYNILKPGYFTRVYWTAYYSSIQRTVWVKIYKNDNLIAYVNSSLNDGTPDIILTPDDYSDYLEVGDIAKIEVYDNREIEKLSGALWHISNSYLESVSNSDDFINGINYVEVNVSPINTNTTYSLGYSLTTLFDFANQVSQNDTNLTIVNDTITLSNDYDDGLVAKYDLRDDFLDTSYNDNDGTGYGGVTANGSETVFDGVDDVIDLDMGSFDFTSPFSVSVWVNPSTFTISGDRSHIISKCAHSYYFCEFALGYSSGDGKIDFIVGNGVDGYAKFASTSVIALPNTWTNLFVVYDGVDTIIYKNSNSESTLNGFSYLSPDTEHKITLGHKFLGGSGEKFNGSIRDVRIYNRSLTETEISNLYTQQKNYNPQGAITKTINLSAYDNKNYCQIKADNINTTGGSVLFYADGTQRYLNQIFSHDGTDDIEVMTKLLRGNATTTPSVTNVKIICGESPDNLSYIECGTNTTSCNVSYTGLSDGEKELNLFVTDTTGEYNYTYNFTVDTIAPAVTQITTNSTTYKFAYEWFFTTTEINPNTCTYSLDGGINRNCNTETFFSTEGTHTVDLTLTDLAGNTFTDSYNLTVNADYAFLEINTYTLNVTDICLNTSTCYYIDTNTTFNATATPEYNFTTSGEKYFTRYYLNDTLAENLTIYVNPIIYFRIYDNARGLYVTDYTLNGDSDTAGVVSYLVYDEGLGNNSYEFSAAGYNNETFYYTFTTSMPTDITFNVTPVTITINVFDEDNASNQLTFDLLMINSTTSLNYTGQINFSAYYNETFTGDLKFVISSTGYASRSLYIELTPYTSASHTIYLMSDNSSYPVVFRTLEVSATTAIEDAVLNFYRYIDGTRTFLAQAKTDSQGYTYFNMDYLSGDYEIIITKDGYVTQELTSIPGVQEYTILMPETNAILNYLFDGFSYKFYPLKSSQYSFPFNGSVSVIDEDNAISSVIFTITSDNFSAQNTSTNANGAFLTIPILNESARYLFNLTVYRNGEKLTFLKYYDYTAESNYTSALPNAAVGMLSDDYNGERIMLMIIGYIIFAAVGSMVGGGVIGSVTGIFSLIIYFGMGWLSVGPLAVFGVFTLLGGFFLRD